MGHGPPVYVFLHLPKTAGTSLVETVRGALEPGEFLDLYGVRRTSAQIAGDIAAMTEGARSRVRFVAGHQVWFGMHELLGREARYVTFLRHPVVRVLSWYNQVVRKASNGYHDEVLACSSDFGEFLRNPASPLRANHMTVMLARDHADNRHNRDECERVDEGVVSRALENLRRFHMVGLHERYAADSAAVLAELGIPGSAGAVNLAPGSQSASYAGLDLATARLCRELNWADMDVYEQALLWRNADRSLVA